MLLMLAAPMPAAANGPTPPRSLFQVPPLPTVAPLPPLSPTATPEPLRQEPPADSTQRLYLPWVGVAGAPASPALSERSENPHKASFIYQVQPGDSLAGLAIEFGRDQRSMACATTLDGSPIRVLRPGENIIIPALRDLCHRVKDGESLAQIAAWYGVTVDDLRAVPQNHLKADAEAHRGQVLLIHNARSRYRDPAERNLPRPHRLGWRFGSGEFMWPISPAEARFSQGFKHGEHMAIDLAAVTGTVVRAADTGTVLKAGWNENGYGYRVVIDHGIDYITLYAHLSEYYVQEGDVVQKGDIIGAVGSTGNSTGPHLHFEVRDYGYLIDPLLVLPPTTELQH